MIHIGEQDVLVFTSVLIGDVAVWILQKFHHGFGVTNLDSATGVAGVSCITLHESLSISNVSYSNHCGCQCAIDTTC